MKRKWLFYFTGFISGLSVMAIELGASRLMAPYFSSSQIVWTIIIGTIMIAMALGNVIGGRMADKYKTPDRLFGWIFAAATWTMLIPLVGKFIIAGTALVLALFVKTGYLVVAAFVSCILVFVFPLMVLGMVTPNLVKYAVTSLEENGRTCGIIEACNTVGSIIGTFLPTFVTIPYVGTSMTFVIFASILYIVCIVYFFFRKKNRVKASSIACVALAAGVLSTNIGTAFWADNIIYEGESIYNYLRVEDTPRELIFSTNVLFGVQSIKRKTPGLSKMFFDYDLAAPIMAGAGENPEISVLILGLGTGTFATQCEYYFGISDIDGVEIDGKIIELSHEYFDLPECVNTYAQDGRAFIASTDKMYDAIMVDAYQDITIPFQMSSIEFFKEVKSHLKPGGAVAINMNMFSESDSGKTINDWLCGTVTNVFDSVYSVRASSNLELFCSDSYDVHEQLEAKLGTIEDNELYRFMRDISDSLEKVEKTDLILTDDKAPVELLSMRVLDEMINEELEYLKGSIKGKGIKELYDMLVSGEF